MQGTNQEQDTRFSDKEKKLLKQMKFGNCLDKQVSRPKQPNKCFDVFVTTNIILKPIAAQVDMSKVKLDVLRPWISKKITEFLHIEDDVVVEFVYNQLEEKNVSIYTTFAQSYRSPNRTNLFVSPRPQFPCPKKMQINLTGFLNGRNARQFMEELWALLLSAQESETGIPEEFIQQKKEEILKREEESKLLDQLKSDIQTDLYMRSERSKSKENHGNGHAPSRRESSGSPLPGPRKPQAADLSGASLSNANKAAEENGEKRKLSPSPDKSKEHNEKVTVSRQKSRDRSRERSNHSRQRSRNRSTDRTHRRSPNRYSKKSRSKSRDAGRHQSDRDRTRNRSASGSKKRVNDSASSRRSRSKERLSGDGLSKIQEKLLNMAEGSKKAKQASATRSLSRSKSR